MTSTIRSSAGRLAAASFTIALLALTAFGAVQRTGAAPVAAGACSPDGAHLLPAGGGRHYLSGVNLPWLGNGYGADFATVEEWGQHTYDSAATDRLFAELRAAGVNSVHWFVFADGRGAPEFDSSSGGAVTGLDATTLPSMADAIRLAARHEIYLVFELFGFDMLMADSTPWGKGEHAGGHRDLIVDPARRASFIEKALVPMLGYPVPGSGHTIGSHPNVLGWMVINEPEWGIGELGAVDPQISEPVSLAEMQRFVAEVAGAIHRNSSQLVTVGSASLRWNSDSAPGASGNLWSDADLTPYDPQGYLDFYNIHYYGYMNGDGVWWSYSPAHLTAAQAGLDKPTIVGEFPANGIDTGFSTAELLEKFLGNCYAGAWAWSYNNNDANGGWADLAGPITEFNARHADLVRIGGGEQPRPAEPTATSQPNPTAQPTATPQPSPTPEPTAEPQPSPTAAPAPADPLIYGDALAPGWANWSWDSTVRLSQRVKVRSGGAAISIVYDAPWAGFLISRDQPLATAGYGKLRLYLHGGSSGGQPITLWARDGDGAVSGQVSLPSPRPRRWTMVEVPLSSLGSPATISQIALQEAGGASRPVFYVDDIALVR